MPARHGTGTPVYKCRERIEVWMPTAGLCLATRQGFDVIWIMPSRATLDSIAGDEPLHVRQQ